MFLIAYLIGKGEPFIVWVKTVIWSKGALGSKSGSKIILVWGYAHQTVALVLPDGTDLGIIQTVIILTNTIAF